MRAEAAVRVRPGHEDDAGEVAALLYETATGMFDVYAGSGESALRILRAAYLRGGNSASRETVTVAEAGGAVAGAIAAFPVSEGDRRARRFMWLTLRRTPPWTWPAVMRVFRIGSEHTPAPPEDALYVDAIATARPFRRRGVATMLLEHATTRAQTLGLGAVALDTAESNRSAQALYERLGFEVAARRRATGGVPGVVAYVRSL